MDIQTKQRLVGASIWLLALIIIVPTWYSNPVNFSPEGVSEVKVKSTLPVVEHAYRLPPSQAGSQTIYNQAQPLTDGQKAQQAKQLEQENISPAPEQNPKQVVEELIDDAFIDRFSNRESYEGQWIVRMQAFNNIKQANELARKIKDNYPVYIKYFEKTRVYSVRTGPYISQSKAEKAKQKLDKILRIDGKVRQLPKNS